MIDLTYDKEKLLRKLKELKEEIPILLERIEKAEREIVNVQTLEDAARYAEENDLNDGFMHIEVF